jgi:hypothetical protein
VTSARIGCIVEGQGELKAVRTIVQRVGQREAPGLTIVTEPVIRVARSKLVSQKDLAAAVDLTARQLKGNGSILIVFDADDDCPAELGPKLQAWASAARQDRHVGLVLAMREFEAWFLAAIE